MSDDATPRPWLDPRDADPAAREAVHAWLALQDPGAWRPAEAARALAEHGGDPRAARRALTRDPPPPAAELERRARALARRGAVLLPLPSSHYPARLRGLCDPAPLLAVRGDPRALSAAAVGIVGPRAGTSAGREVAHALAADLARAGLCVVSGLARGVDAAAHRGSLAGGGPGVAVLPCGPDAVYPPEHARLAERLAARGAVVSELPPGAAPLRQHFPLRNRLISGLCRALVVVEARERSGTLITAGHARDQGLTVLAVPGPVGSPVHRGSNLLLRQGATPCLDADDVLGALGLPPAGISPADPLAGVESRPQRAVLGALLQEPATPDELARRLARPAAEVAADLLELELAGRIRRERDGRLRARVERGLS